MPIDLAPTKPMCGVFPILITPYGDDGVIEKKLCRLIDFNTANGFNSFSAVLTISWQVSDSYLRRRLGFSNRTADTLYSGIFASGSSA